MPLAEGSFKVWIYLGFIVGLTRSSRPRFDTSTDMRKVLIPPDADVDSVIFRLRATDEEPDFPLIFNVTATVIPVVRIENLPCTLYNKVCQANVILTRRLSPGKFYDFLVVVRDSKGENNSMQATISVTNGTTPRNKIFLHKPSLIMVAEDAKPGTELDYLIVQSNPWSNKPVYIELWQPKDLFKIIQRQTERQTQGIITLIGELDFETQSMHTLTMYATDPYTELMYDTRNIVGLQVVVIVQDVQDVPPIFTLAPPLTKINNTVQPGDVILRVHAEDGDKGVPREVTYGLVSEYNPFTTFFNINETSGEISLARPLDEVAQIARVGAPILLSVVAEEIRHSWDEPPAQATVVEIGILLGEPENSPPYFESDNYISYIDENADPGTTLQFSNPNATKVKDDDIGKAGVFTLKLLNNNGTFEIMPSVAERSATFIITVRDNSFLDYEIYKTLSFKIFVQEVGPMTNLSANAIVTVFLKDVNDNPPEFDESIYEVALSENSTVGTKVVQVHATDKDTGIFGSISYTGITGLGSEAFLINSESGLITITAKSEALDRERTEKLELFVEARDEDGNGLKSKVPLIVHLLDVNDNAPIFEKNPYKFRLNSDMTNFTTPAIIKAIDADAEPPNNEIRYEIIQGNYENKFKLDEITGELFVREQIRKPRHVRENEMQHLIPDLRKEHPFTAANLSGNRKHFIMTESSIEHLKKNGPDYETNLIPRFRVKRADENPLFTLTVRAYDLGVPLMSNVVSIHILHGITPGARIVTFVMPGDQLDPNKAAETLATITGGRVTIQEIRPYVENQRNQSDLPNNNNKRSVIVARVEQSNSETLVDIEKIRKNLAANGVGVISGMDGMQTSASDNTKTDVSKTHFSNITHIQDEEVTVYKAENKLLLWLLIIFIVLLLLAIAAVILCCICPGCPFYMEPRKRRIHSSETLIVRSDGRQKRHVQRTHLKVVNGFWPDKKQAWSADRERKNWHFNKRNMAGDYGMNSLPGDIAQVTDAKIEPMPRNAGPAIIHNETVHIHREKDMPKRRADDKIFIEDIETHGESRTFDMDSMRRHEFERGSDIVQKSYQNIDDQHQIDNYDDTEVREQHFYRDGNAEILRLVTRGHAEEETPSRRQNLTEQQSHAYNGKDILLQRFIEDQKLRKEQVQEAEIRSMDAALRNGKEIMQPEIILIPGSLDQRHLENLRSDIQQLIMDRNDYAELKKTERYENQAKLHHNIRDIDPGVPTIEVTRVVDRSLGGSNEKIMPPYTIHDIELVRQNNLLTRLLLERETKVTGGITADVASYLETQSLPGQVAIATQTDRTTATQTDCRLRSRSDNESEEESKFKRKFKFKKRYIETECPHRMKSIWMKSPTAEKSRTYIGIKMAGRRKMPEISDGRKTISPIVLQEISESLNGRDHFSSNIEEEDEDDRLFHYAREPIKETKIEARKETIEISTSSQEEMEHRIADASQQRNFDIVDYNKKSKKVFPVEPSFRVLEGDSSPRKKIRKVEERKAQKGTSDVSSIKAQETKTTGSQSKKAIKSTRESKVKELKSTMDATISKILGHDKKAKNIAKPMETEHKLRKPLKHQQAAKVDSASSELDDAVEVSKLHGLQSNKNYSKEQKLISPIEAASGLKKVSTYADLSKSETKTSLKSSKNAIPAKKLSSSTISPLSDINETSPTKSRQQLSPLKKISNLKKVKSSSELSKSDSKSEKSISDLDSIKSKRKSHRDESSKSLNVEHSTEKVGKSNLKEVHIETENQNLNSDRESKAKSNIAKVKTTQKNVNKEDSAVTVIPTRIQTNLSHENNENDTKVEQTNKENIICVTDSKKATMKFITTEVTEPGQEKISESIVEKKETKERNRESSTENDDNESYTEISYSRFTENEEEKLNNIQLDSDELNKKQEVVEKEANENQNKIPPSRKAVFQKQERVTDSSEEEQQTSNSVEKKTLASLNRQFTDDFTKKLEELAIDFDQKQSKGVSNQDLSNLECKQKKSDEERNDTAFVSETISEKESTDKQKLKTSEAAEVADLKTVQESDLCVTVGEDGNQLPRHDKLEELGKKSPKLERSNKIMSDSITPAVKESLNIDYDSESSDESDLSSKTMLNRQSLEGKETKAEEQILVTEAKGAIEKAASALEAELTAADETKTVDKSKSDARQMETIIDDSAKLAGTSVATEKLTVISEINNGKVRQFTEDKHHPINVPEKKLHRMEKPPKTNRLLQDISQSQERETRSEVAKKLVMEKEQKSKSQIETCEQNKKDKSSRREDDKNPSKSLKVERKKKVEATDTEADKKREKSPGQIKVPEARSRYMAWYKQKREEMERKREERKQTEEEEQRPRWARRTKTKYDAGTPETTPQTRRKVKPLINVESEQLKAIVRQGRKMRKGRVEDPSVQIFVPEKPPPQTSEVSSTPRHHLVQHSEYKYERVPPPFYLHPPPAPHPSPEHFPDFPIRERVHEDDIDSGIAVSLTGPTKLRHQQLLEKKSVFDIAYSEASPTKLCSDSSTPPAS